MVFTSAYLIFVSNVVGELIKMFLKIGPESVPWGTLRFDGHLLDTVLVNLLVTCCVRFVRTSKQRLLIAWS